MNNNSGAPPSLLLRLAITTLAYVLTGWPSLWLAIPPSYAAPIYPAAGVALACTLVYGLRVLPAVALGAFTVNALLSAARGQPMLSAVLSPAIIAAGAALQAGAGAFLARRFVAQPLTLSEPRDVLRFFALSAVLACTLSATIATLTLKAAGSLGDVGPAYTWWTWYTGDLLGVLIGAPVALTLIGEPRAEWRHRRTTVGLSLVLVTALLATATAQVTRWDEQRIRVIFERDASRSAEAVADSLRDSLEALESVNGTARAMGSVSADSLRKSSRYWLSPAFHLQAVGWAQRVPRQELPDFERLVRQDGGPAGYHVFDRTDPQSAPEARQDAEVMAIRFIEPPERNTAALGVNPLSIAPARPAILAAQRSGKAVASGGFRLTQETGDQTGVVIYQPTYQGEATTEAERLQRNTGMLFVTLRMDEAVKSVMSEMPAYLNWCVVDTAPGNARPRLAGPVGCETLRPSGFVHLRPIEFAGRHWELRLHAPVNGVPETAHWNAWLFSVVGLMATAMLGAMLLSVTGRTRRIEVAVAERTADLQREVGERTRTEIALRDSEQRFRNILDHVPIGVLYTDLTGRIREANPRLRDMVGYSAEELSRLHAIDLTHPEDQAEDTELSGKLLRGEIAGFDQQKRFVAKDGRVLWVKARVSLLHDNHGRPQWMVGVVEDITEHLKLQDAERARESAEAANRAKSDFLSRMSHELRTPLNAMLGFAQLLELDRQQPLASHQVEWTSQIQQAGWHLLHMINDTLDLSRIESGTLKLDLEPVAVAEVVSASRALVEQSAQRRQLRIEEDLDPRVHALHADETRVKQILTNLLSNAVKYNVQGGTILIRSRRVDAQTAEIEVRDTGLGMDAAQMADLFQPFNRLGREAYGEGTGIGLVISRRLAELMGGTLNASSAPGEGSSFVLQLPLARETQRFEHEAPDDDPLAPGYRQRVVHYIEDNETNAEVMRGIVAQRPQVKLQVSGTGLDGLAAIRLRRPSLVLLDMHLPDVDGIELLRHLKRDAQTADIPVVVVSADATPGRIDEAMSLGAERYVTKPVNVAEVLSILDELLEHADTRFG